MAVTSLKKWVAVELLLIFLFFSYFPCISYTLLQVPVLSSVTPSTSWKNSPSIEQSSWDFVDGSTVRPILFVREQGWSRQGTNKPAFCFGFYSNLITSNELFYLAALLLPRSDTEFRLTPPVVVWFANGDGPVQENATKDFTPAGNLQLIDADGKLASSTNTSGLSVIRLNISDGGNLVLLDDKANVPWQSFDHPTNTWLPTQKNSFGQGLVGQNPLNSVAVGQYFLSVSNDGIDAFIASSLWDCIFSSSISCN